MNNIFLTLRNKRFLPIVKALTRFEVTYVLFSYLLSRQELSRGIVLRISIYENSMLCFTLSRYYSVQAHENRAKQWKKICKSTLLNLLKQKGFCFSLREEGDCATVFPQ